MKKFLFLGLVIIVMGMTEAGSCQYAPIAKDAYPLQRPGLPAYPTPVKRTLSNSRVVRKVKPGPPKKQSGFIPLYPNGKPTPVRVQKIQKPPMSGPVSVLAPRNIPYPSLYRDPQ
jgi:hypothetical protein